MSDPIGMMVKLAELSTAGIDHVSGGSPGKALLMERFSPDARLARSLKQAESQWWERLWRLLSEHQERLSDAERRDAWARILDDFEGGVLFANYAAEAFREPLQARRRMLEHAAAGLMNMDLTLGELVQIWRVVRELGEDDVMKLYALWLIPNKELSPGNTPDRARGEVVDKHGGGDALLACGALRSKRPPSTWGDSGAELLTLTRRGRLVLSGLRTYLSARPLPFNVPGHERTGADCNLEEAQRRLAELPFVGTLRAYRNTRFAHGYVTYDAPNVGAGMPHNGRAQLVFRRVTEAHAAALPPPERRALPLGQAVEECWIDTISQHQGVEGSEVHLHGPHDVLRVLAYDLFAAW